MKSVCRFFLAAAVTGAAVSPLFAAPIATNASANLVLGQPTFLTNANVVPATPSSLARPSSVAVDPTTGKVFVADEDNNRVLRYASGAALANGADPEIVIGQVNFSETIAATTQTGLSAPTDLYVDADGRLWIADTGNNRVLMFLLASRVSNRPFADRVFGQANFTSALAAPTATNLAAPRGLCVDSAGTLWVADTGSHRVLGFTNAATALANGPAATRVLGQLDFTGNTAATTQTKFFEPTDVSADASGHLWVADRGNNRVLMFANPPLINGAPANVVLGQATYISATAGASSAALNQPTSVFAEGTSLWVADDFNNRVLRFNAAATRLDGTAANAVVGQANFTAKLPGLSARQFALLSGQLTVDASGSLWVADRLNNRVLRFVRPPDPNAPPTVAITGERKFTTTKNRVTISGTAADDIGLARVSYQLGTDAYRVCSGTTNWSARVRLKKGLNKINVRSVDLAGAASLPVTYRIKRK